MSLIHCAARTCLIAVLLGLASLIAPHAVHAYAWMNRHQYSNCATCHADPSGAGLLTAYGRAQSALLLSSQYPSAGRGRDAACASAPEAEGCSEEEAEEPGRFPEFGFGLFKLPEQLLLGAWLRNAYVWNAAGKRVVDDRYLLMRADVAAQLTLGIVRVNGSLGVVTKDADRLSQEAWLTSSESGPNLVSREFWMGVDLADASMLLRAGRIAVPFGIRTIEHTSWVRNETRTDINQHQQVGIAFSFNNERVRAEVMALLGNYQVSPDAYRERGYSGYAELHVKPGWDVGVSSLVAGAKANLVERARLLRGAHGVFARIAPIRLLAFLVEADLLTATRDVGGTDVGFVGWLQADVEPWQGLHGIVGVEALRQARAGADAAAGFWAGVAWFFLPHFDLRGDFVHRELPSDASSNTYLLQLHLYL